jgi:hypothetical protein
MGACAKNGHTGVPEQAGEPARSVGEGIEGIRQAMKAAIEFTIEQKLRKLLLAEGVELIRQIVQEELRKILGVRKQ